MTTNNSDTIDLTSSFSLVDHYSLNNVFIDLDTDESFHQDQISHENIAETERIRNPLRKRRRATKARTPNPTVANGPLLLGSEGKIIKKSANKNKNIQEKLPEEPEEKKAKIIGCCPICLEDFGSKPLSSTKCGHVFCSDCIQLALKGAACCPQCRMRLKGATAVHPIFL